MNEKWQALSSLEKKVINTETDITISAITQVRTDELNNSVFGSFSKSFLFVCLAIDQQLFFSGLR